MPLAEHLLDSKQRQRVIDDVLTLIDEEVSKKSGLSGFAIKAAYGVVKAVKKGIIREAVDHMLDGFVSKLEPFYAQRQSATMTATLTRDPSAVADALLSITDDKARDAENATLKKAYAKLRPTAKEHVQAAVPGLAKVLDKHVPVASAA
jgi:hypothetical protein